MTTRSTISLSKSVKAIMESFAVNSKTDFDNWEQLLLYLIKLGCDIEGLEIDFTNNSVRKIKSDGEISP